MGPCIEEERFYKSLREQTHIPQPLKIGLIPTIPLLIVFKPLVSRLVVTTIVP